MSSNTHVLEMPKGFLGIRIAQLVIAIIEVGLIAYLMSSTHGFVFSAQAWTILCGKLAYSSFKIGVEQNSCFAGDLLSRRASESAQGSKAVIGRSKSARARKSSESVSINTDFR